MRTQGATSGFDGRYPQVFERLTQVMQRDRSHQRLKRMAAVLIPTAAALLIPYREPLQLQGVVTTRVTQTASAPFAANIHKLLVAPDSQVRAGQPVLQLSSADYREQQVKTVAELRALKRRIQQALDTLSDQSRQSEATQIQSLRSLIGQLPDSESAALIRQTQMAVDAELEGAADQVQEKKAALRRLQGKLSDFRIELAYQKRQLSYYVDALNKGAVSPAFVDGLRREVAKSVKDLRDTEASIAEAQALVQQSQNQYTRLKAQRQVSALEQLDELVPQFRFLLERYRRFNTGEFITVKAPASGSISGLESLRLGSSVNQGQSLFTIVDPATGFTIQATADSRSRAKMKPGMPAVIRYDNPTDGSSERIAATVASIGALSLENAKNTPGLDVKKSANFSVTLKPDATSEKKYLAILSHVYPGELVWVTAYGSSTNLLFTFVRPLRVSINHWFGT